MSEVLGLDIPKFDFSFDILSFAVRDILILLITIRQARLLSVPAKAKYIFAAEAIAVCTRLVLDFVNQSQGFHAGHVVLSLAVVALIHDAIVSSKRARQLEEVLWR